MLDVLYGEFVQMFWAAANPRDSIKHQNRRPQPDWWDDENGTSTFSPRFGQAAIDEDPRRRRRKKVIQDTPLSQQHQQQQV